MSLSIALAGKPNSGKSTFFKAATLANVEIANYPFTTIDANYGVSYVTAKCQCKELKIECANCKDGIRFIPAKLIDVAGLVPDAHKGRGLGNAFLDNLRQASAIIHIVDASGSTDLEGNPTEIGRHDPIEDVRFFEYELTMWLFGILKRNWNRLSRKMKAESLKVEKVISEQLIGAGVTELQVKNAISRTELDKKNPHNWTDEELEKLANIIRSVSKPMILAANKIDIAPKENIKKLMELNYIVVPVSAEAELALRMADKSKAISYISGDSKFEIISDKLTKAQKKGLEKLQNLLKEYNGTGVQNCLNAAALELLDQIIVYPVEDENKYADKDGRVLPDAFLMKKGSNALDLAYLIHSDLGDGFLFAIDARTKKRIGEKYELKDGDVIKIVSTK